jgi:hypothetical protein
MIETLVVRMLENAPAVAVLLYLVYRLDMRLCELQDVLIELVKQGKG